MVLAKKEGFAYKIPDLGMENPVDMVFMKDTASYVVILFNSKVNRKGFYIIDIDDFIKLREASQRKSLTESDAIKIGFFYIL